jgi:integrase
LTHHKDDLLVQACAANGHDVVSKHRRRSPPRPLAIGRSGLHPPELRHTAASLAIASGADVKVVEQMLGHASAARTLDQYGHLFGDRLDEVADRMASARQAAVAPVLPETLSVDLTLVEKSTEPL